MRSGRNCPKKMISFDIFFPTRYILLESLRYSMQILSYKLPMQLKRVIKTSAAISIEALTTREKESLLVNTLI